MSIKCPFCKQEIDWRADTVAPCRHVKKIDLAPVGGIVSIEFHDDPRPPSTAADLNELKQR